MGPGAGTESAASEALLLSAAPLAGEADRELAMPGPALHLVPDRSFAQELVRTGVGVMSTQLPLAYLDADFFADLEEA